MAALELFSHGLPGFSHLRLPVYGLFAAAGLTAALWLSQRTATEVGLAPERLWDAGMAAILAAFIASRALLAVQSPREFLHYPLLLLSLPSFTYGGMALTALGAWAYLRWKRLALLDVLDAWAPCAALLCAALQMGHFAEGTDFGMPSHLPWAAVERSSMALGRTHPVGIYAAALGLLLCGVLLKRLPVRAFAGEVTALGLMTGGAVAFLLAMWRQPEAAEGWLDRSQWAAGAAVVAGITLWIWESASAAERNRGKKREGVPQASIDLRELPVSEGPR